MGLNAELPKGEITIKTEVEVTDRTYLIARDYSAETTECASHLMTPQWLAICLLLIWSLLTVLAAGMCCASCLLPFWIAGSVDLPASGGRIISSVSHLGLFRRCGYPTYESNGDVVWIQGCGYYPTMESVPHWVWRVTLALLIIAACLLVLLVFFVICETVCASLLRRSLEWSRACFNVYLVANRSSYGYEGCWLAYPLALLRVEWLMVLAVLRTLRGLLGIRADDSMWCDQRDTVGNAKYSTISPPPPLPSSDAKYALLPPSYSHPHLLPPWNTMENSVFMGGIGGGGGINCYARRCPHSFVISSNPSTLMDLTRRLSCSVFCPIPEQKQAELPPTKPTVSLLMNIAVDPYLLAF
ncbi:LHFPL tetraspan subfamily member 6 protein [Taenia solium]|eukprot:TsM_000120900 transcript=TsM_000120900 gene=TsM_000120900